MKTLFYSSFLTQVYSSVKSFVESSNPLSSRYFINSPGDSKFPCISGNNACTSSGASMEAYISAPLSINSHSFFNDLFALPFFLRPSVHHIVPEVL